MERLFMCYLFLNVRIAKSRTNYRPKIQTTGHMRTNKKNFLLFYDINLDLFNKQNLNNHHDLIKPFLTVQTATLRLLCPYLYY